MKLLVAALFATVVAATASAAAGANYRLKVKNCVCQDPRGPCHCSGNGGSVMMGPPGPLCDCGYTGPDGIGRSCCPVRTETMSDMPAMTPTMLRDAPAPDATAPPRFRPRIGPICECIYIGPDGLERSCCPPRPENPPSSMPPKMPPNEMSTAKMSPNQMDLTMPGESANCACPVVSDDHDAEPCFCHAPLPPAKREPAGYGFAHCLCIIDNLDGTSTPCPCNTPNGDGTQSGSGEQFCMCFLDNSNGIAMPCNCEAGKTDFLGKLSVM